MQEIERIEIRGKGRRPRLYGHIVKYSDGTSVYYARRKHKHIHRDGCTSISEAMLLGKAGWAIDLETLINVRSKVGFIGIEVVDNGDRYITPIETYFKAGNYKSILNTCKGFSEKQQRTATLDKFVKSSGKITVHQDLIEPE